MNGYSLLRGTTSQVSKYFVNTSEIFYCCADLEVLLPFRQIPLIKEAQQLSDRGLHLVAGAWTAPPWMKTNDDYSGFGFLKDEYYQTWADYLVK